jgi:hypothetical protein
VLASHADPARAVAHRIETIERLPDGMHVRTRGDANAEPDPGPIVITEPRTQVVVGRIPLLGHVALAANAVGIRVALLALVLASLTFAGIRVLLGRGRARRSTAIAGAALLVVTTMTAMEVGAPRDASADATAPTVLDATLSYVGVAAAPAPVRDALEVLVADAVARGAMARGVMTVLAGGDPLSVDPMLCTNLRREQRRWADVGPVWTRAYAALGEDVATCDLSGDSPCARVLRLRLQTIAGDRLAAQEECDLDCAHRLEQLQQRLERSAALVEELDAAAIATAGLAGPVDVSALVGDAALTWGRLAERVRRAELEAPVPDPGFDPECEAVPPFGPGGRP